jgi:hypothetical protein
MKDDIKTLVPERKGERVPSDDFHRKLEASCEALQDRERLDRVVELYNMGPVVNKGQTIPAGPRSDFQHTLSREGGHVEQMSEYSITVGIDTLDLLMVPPV